MRRTKHIIVSLITVLALALVPASIMAGTAYADCPGGDTAEGQVLKGIGQTGSECDGDGVANAIAAVVNILSYIVGVAAVIVVIYSGFKYITASGDSNKIGNAKSTLIYALIGLVVAALAQVLVQFVLSESSRAVQTPCPPGESRNAAGNCA